MLHAPLETSEIPGFSGLTVAQAKRLQDIGESGYGKLYEGLVSAGEQRYSKLKDFVENAGEAYGESQELKAQQLKQDAETKQALEKRRQNAVDDFMSLREEIAKEGVPLSVESGQKFLQDLQTTDNPEAVLNDYVTAAFANPAVTKAFKPKKGGGGKKGSKKVSYTEVGTALEDSDYEMFARDLALGDIDEIDLEALLEEAGSTNIKYDMDLIKKRAFLLERTLGKIFGTFSS